MQELARAIGRERVEFDDEGLSMLKGGAAKERYSRIERLLRVLWTLSLEGNLAAIRCLIATMEGKPGQGSDETAERALTPKQVAELVAVSVAKVQEWQAGQLARRTEPSRADEPGQEPEPDQISGQSG